MDQRTDQRTDKASYRDVRTHLKIMCDGPTVGPTHPLRDARTHLKKKRSGSRRRIVGFVGGSLAHTGVIRPAGVDTLAHSGEKQPCGVLLVVVAAVVAVAVISRISRILICWR